MGCATPRPAAPTSRHRTDTSPSWGPRDTHDGAGRPGPHADPAVRAPRCWRWPGCRTSRPPPIAEADRPGPSVRAWRRSPPVSSAWPGSRCPTTSAPSSPRRSSGPGERDRPPRTRRARRGGGSAPGGAGASPPARSARRWRGPGGLRHHARRHHDDSSTSSPGRGGAGCRRATRATVPARPGPWRRWPLAYLVPTRWAGVYAWGGWGCHRPAGAAQGATDVDPEVRGVAAKGLADVALPRTCPRCALLRDDDGWPRRAVKPW